MASAPPRRLLTRLTRDRSLNVKILSVVGVLAVFSCFIGGLSISRMAALNAEADELYHSGLVPVQRIAQVYEVMTQTRVAVLNHALSSDPTTQQKYEDEVNEAHATFNNTLDSYVRDSVAPELIDPLRSAWSIYVRICRDQVIPAGRAGDRALVERLRDEETGPAYEKAVAVVQELSARESADGKRRADAAAASYNSSRIIVVASLGAGLLISVGFGLLVARGIVRSVKRVSWVVAGLAAGDLARHADLDSRDEIGRMAGELDAANDRLGAIVNRIGGSSATLARAADELSAVSSHIADSAASTSSRAERVTTAAAEVARNVETVSAGTEEMTASIREIAGSATDAARVAHGAVGLVETANDTVGQLGRSGGEIGSVVKLITSIAEQTNLLALNATIEAARAGEAGKGFAVVASEVKDLAQATARATDDISQRIGAIRSDTEAAVTAIGEISAVIERVSGYSATIASAVEQQTATTGEMGRHVASAFTAAGDIASNIDGVADAARTTDARVNDSRRAAADLARMASELQELVGEFRTR
jgi:methyl-accepting chemotaxis protein